MSKTHMNLVLDLDNTLIDTFVPDIKDKIDEYFNIFKKEENFLMMVKQFAFVGFVFLRPCLVEFLQKAQQAFNLYIYSAGGEYYVKTIVKAILSKIPSIHIKFIWTRENMIDDKKCIARHLDVQTTYIIDDIPNFWRQKCWRIKSFKSFDEIIHIDEKTNKNTHTLKKLYKDDDRYLIDFFINFLKMIQLEYEMI